MDIKKIAILIPCYNESKTIRKVVESYRQVLPEADIYVYDNNSIDGTDEIARQAGANVRYEYRQGKGNVIRSMFRDIDADCYLMTDGDNTYPAGDSMEMCRLVLEKGVDMVIGDRLSSNYFEENKRPFHVLEHIENDTKELAVWTTKLKENSKLLIYVPAFQTLFSSMDKKVGHFRRYTQKELKRKTTEAGLQIVKQAQYADSLGFFVSLLYKWIGSDKGNINPNTLIFYDRFLFPISRVCDVFFRNIFGKNVFIVVEK